MQDGYVRFYFAYFYYYSVLFIFYFLFHFTYVFFRQFFPFDKQNCTLIFSSWTLDAAQIDYYPHSDSVYMESYVENEEWRLISFETYRHETKYECCPNPYVLLHSHLVIQRKPLYYLINLVIPTAIITLVAVAGFFMPASSTGERMEKVNLGITTLLAMSILLLMVSDQMPTTSDFVPLIGWIFILITYV